MIAGQVRTSKAAPATRSPTEYLLRSEKGKLSPMMVYRLTTKGFVLDDVKKMLGLSVLYSNNKVMSRIFGVSVRTLQRKGNAKQPAQLNPHQSAVALQYAQVLEHATNVFGTQQLAEEWLGRPCKYLEGDVPLEVIDNPIAFQAVEDYLERIEYGVYQ